MRLNPNKSVVIHVLSENQHQSNAFFPLIQQILKHDEHGPEKNHSEHVQS